MTAPTTRTRVPLTRERVLRAAVAIADAEGLAALSMRRLGREVGVEAMSLYNHVASKDDLLGGVADLVAAEFEVPESGSEWREGLRRSAHSTHEVLLRHPWAAALLESRPDPGPDRLRYLNAVLGTMRRNGFPVEVAYHAFRILDSYVYGYTLQEVAWPFEESDMSDVAADMLARPELDAFPHLTEMGRYVRDGGHDPAADFDVGLDLVLDGLDRMRAEARAGTTGRRGRAAR